MCWSEGTIGKLMASAVPVVCPTRRLIAVEMTSLPPWHREGITVLLSRKTLFAKRANTLLCHLAQCVCTLR